MGYVELRDSLKYYITTIFNNEDEFIDEFLQDWEDGNIIEVTECYFASERVRLELFNIDTGNHITTTVSTMAVCEWVDRINEQ